jgi:uncharacterized protein involved in exopolysaccharide biosynthesis
MDNTINNMYLLNLTIKWRKHLIIILISVILISIIFTAPYFISPKFKSYSTIYPSNLLSYSNESVTEQMLQLFKSDDIRDDILKKFKLATHYKVDTTKQYYHTKLIRIWNNNVTIHKTEYESVEIEVLDTDPVLARDIVNEMILLFNQKVRQMMREKTSEVVVMLRKQLNERKAERDSLSAKIDKIRQEYNILDFGSQAREATRGYVLPNGKNTNASKIIKSLQDKGGEYNLLNSQLENTNRNYLSTKTEYENSLKDLTKELTYTNIVNKPVPADRKCYPIRWLIVIISVVSSYILSMLIIIMIERTKTIDN